MSDLPAALRRAVGEEHVRTHPVYPDLRNRRTGRALCEVHPADAEQVAEVVRLCVEAGVPMVPMGGNTGHVAGQIPPEHGRAAVICLNRLNRIRSLEPDCDTLIAEAGVSLHAVRSAAEAAGRMFPLSIASEGSAQIGGLIGTNAGGDAVLRYGQMRALVSGIEAVLPDGTLWRGTARIRKNNAGYDLKQWFIGAEGTLGIVTAASLRLFPRPRARSVGLFALRDLQDMLRLFNLLEAALGARLSCFELLSAASLAAVQRHAPPGAPPFAEIPPYAVLVEAEVAGILFEDAAAEALSAQVALDAVAAADAGRAAELRAWRERISEAQKGEGASLKHDVSVPRVDLPAFVDEVNAAAAAAVPGIRPVVFGHAADGNLHYNFSQPVGPDPAVFLASADRIRAIVHTATSQRGGSIAAEHGVGRIKAAELAAGDPVAAALMRALKQALDPKGLMNPGCIFPEID